MSTVTKLELEKLINKPRAFRNISICDGAPIRQTMIFLCSESLNTYETPRNYKRLIQNRKYKNNEPLF